MITTRKGSFFVSPHVAVKKLLPGLMEAILDQLKKGRKAQLNGVARK